MSEKNHQNSREDLLEAAKKVFADLGFDRATVKDLADEAGVNVSSISYYFGGKESLYESCLKDFAQLQLGFADRFLKAPTTKDDFKLRLRLFAEEFVQLHLKERNLCRILHRDFEAQNPIAMEVFKTSFVPIYKSLEQFIGFAKKSKIIRQDVDVAMSTFFIFGMIIHIVRSDRVSVGQPKNVESMIDYLITTALEGVFK